MSKKDLAALSEFSPAWTAERGLSPDTDISTLKVALVHDWLTGMRGGEKALETLCDMFSDAPLWTLVPIFTFYRLLRNLVPAPVCGDGGHGVLPRLVAAAGEFA
jgi:hypothetical protein